MTAHSNSDLLAVHVVKRYDAEKGAAETWCGQAYALDPGNVQITTRWADYDPHSPWTINPQAASIPVCADCLPHLDQHGNVPLGLELHGH